MERKRIWIALLATGLLAAPFDGAVAGIGPRRVERTETKSYNAPGPALHTPAASVFIPNGCGTLPEGCVLFETKRRENYVRIEVRDKLGRPVYFVVGNQAGGYLGGACKTGVQGPFPIVGGADIAVFLIEGTCEGSSTSLSVVTQGTVKAIFSNVP